MGETEKMMPIVQVYCVEMDELHTVTNFDGIVGEITISIPPNVTTTRMYHTLQLWVNRVYSGIYRTVEVLTIYEELGMYEPQKAYAIPDVLPDEGGSIVIYVEF